MRFYLAHPILIRDKVRALELEFEANTGHELINPFYDVDRTDINEIDTGIRKPWHGKLDSFDIVTRDVKAILSSKGVIMVIDGVLSIGTFQEQSIASFATLIKALRKIGVKIDFASEHLFDKPVYVVCFHKPWLNHPWLKFFSDTIVESFGELEDLLGSA